MSVKFFFFKNFFFCFFFFKNTVLKQKNFKKSQLWYLKISACPENIFFLLFFFFNNSCCSKLRSDFNNSSVFFKLTSVTIFLIKHQFKKDLFFIKMSNVFFIKKCSTLTLSNVFLESQHSDQYWKLPCLFGKKVLDWPKSLIYFFFFIGKK